MIRRGISLLELTVTTSLLVVVFLVLINLLPSMIYAGTQARHRMAATALAGEILDQCSAGPYERLQVGVWTPAAAGPLAGYLQDQVLDDQVVLSPQVRVAAVTGFDLANLVQVTVTVRWQHRRRNLEQSRLRRIASIRR